MECRSSLNLKKKLKNKNIPRTIMSSANVLPSAPDYAETVQPLYPMHEITEINSEDFRLKRSLIC